MSKHTPGPWTAKMSKWHEESLLVQAGMPSNRVLARFGSATEPLDDTDRANARLISAAPEMLEALKDVVNYFWSPEFDRPALAEGDVEEFVRGAIKKATGE
jgi:hypothetical protein